MDSSTEKYNKQKRDQRKYSRNKRRKSKSYSRSRSRHNDEYEKSNKNSASKSNSRSRSFRKNKISKRKSKWSDVPISETNLFNNTVNITTELETLKSKIPLISINQKNTGDIVTSTINNTNLPIINTSNPNFFYTLADSSKLKTKVFIPKLPGVNFVGLLIGPKGTYQKRLEIQTNCKILIRGKGTQKEGMAPQPDDNEEQHVLIVGDTDESVNKAKLLVERVLNADEETRNKIKEEQLKAAQEIKAEIFENYLPDQIDDHLMTPYGPPDKNARIVPVPNDCVGLIIGKNGETIRKLNRETGCKIQIAKKEIPNTEVRNVFIEGPPEKYELGKTMIEEIVAEQQKMKANLSQIGEINPFPGPYIKHKVPNKYVGLIIGKNGETIKTLHQTTGCFIFIPKESKPGEDFRILEFSGQGDSTTRCIKEIQILVENADSQNVPVDNYNLKSQNHNISQQHEINFNKYNGQYSTFVKNVNDQFQGKLNPLTMLNQNALNTNPKDLLSSYTNMMHNSYHLNNRSAFLPGNLNINLINSNNFNYPYVKTRQNMQFPFDCLSTNTIQNNPSYLSNNFFNPYHMININNFYNTNHINNNSSNMYLSQPVGISNINNNNTSNLNLNNNFIVNAQRMVDHQNSHPQLEKNKQVLNQEEKINKKKSGGILNYIYGGQV